MSTPSDTCVSREIGFSVLAYPEIYGSVSTVQRLAKCLVPQVISDPHFVGGGLSHGMYLLTSLRKSTPARTRQLIVYYY